MKNLTSLTRILMSLGQLVSLLACSDQGAGDHGEAIDAQANGIVDGTSATDNDLKQGYIVQLDTRETGQSVADRCTGVVMRNQHILTAKHCVSDHNNVIKVDKITVNKYAKKADEFDIFLHPSLDLAIIKPSGFDGIIPKVNDKPLFQGELLQSENMDIIFGSGCTEFGMPTFAARKAKMKIFSPADTMLVGDEGQALRGTLILKAFFRVHRGLVSAQEGRTKPLPPGRAHKGLVSAPRMRGPLRVRPQYAESCRRPCSMASSGRAIQEAEGTS